MNPYINNTDSEVQQMLSMIGVKSIDGLFVDIKPEHRPKSFNLPEGKSEFEVMRILMIILLIVLIIWFIVQVAK